MIYHKLGFSQRRRSELVLSFVDKSSAGKSSRKSSCVFSLLQLAASLLSGRLYAPGGRRDWLFCAAWSISSGLISSVALTLAWPAPLPASEIAAALTLSGKSTIAKTSVSPKAKYNASNLPPADLKNCSAACLPLGAPVFRQTSYTVLCQGNLHKKLRHMNLLVKEPLLNSCSSLQREDPILWAWILSGDPPHMTIAIYHRVISRNGSAIEMPQPENPWSNRPKAMNYEQNF